MKNLFSALLILLTLSIAFSQDAEAQRFRTRNRYNSVGVSLNAMNYFGDVTPEADFTSLRLKSTRPSLAVSYTRRFFPRISGRASFSWGRITGDDAKSASPEEDENAPRFKRNLSFRNDIKELSVVGIVDLFENRRSYLRRPDFTPYVFAGVGVFHHNPKAYYDGDAIATGWYELQPLGTEGQYSEGEGYPEPYSRIQFTVPVGLGARYRIDKRWDIALEIGWRKTFTDYLDDVSGTYADKNDLKSPEAVVFSDRSVPGTPGYGMKGDQRGDITDDDWYITTGITLSYILRPTRRGPKFR